jgi:hypothetical protein
VTVAGVGATTSGEAGGAAGGLPEPEQAARERTSARRLQGGIGRDLTAGTRRKLGPLAVFVRPLVTSAVVRAGAVVSAACMHIFLVFFLVACAGSMSAPQDALPPDAPIVDVSDQLAAIAAEYELPALAALAADDHAIRHDGAQTRPCHVLPR